MFKTLAACLITVLVMLSAPAQADDIDSVIPDTPAGRQLENLITAFMSEDHETFIKTHFTEEFLEHFPMDAQLGFFREVAAMHGCFVVHAIERSTETSITAIAVGEKSGGWRQIDLQVEPAPPHKIASFGIDMAADPTAPEEQMVLNSFDDLDAYLKRKTESNRFSGVVLIAKEDKPVFEKAYGFASKRFKVPNNIDTKFNIGSINKVFTTVAMYQLMEKGKLNFDDTIGKHLDGFPVDVAETVMIRHLLKQESGWGAYWENEYYLNHWTELRTIDDYMVFIKDIPLGFEPGSQQQYSNTGFIVLGAIIEKASGMSYYDYVREHIFAPAGMPNTDSYAMVRGMDAGE